MIEDVFIGLFSSYIKDECDNYIDIKKLDNLEQEIKSCINKGLQKRRGKLLL